MVLRRGGRRRAGHDLVLVAGHLASRARASPTWRGADLPGVIINVHARRPGPRRHPALPGRLLAGHARRSGTATSRSSCYAPSTVQEMADYVYDAFDTGRPLPHARHDPGRRHAGPDDGAGGSFPNRKETRSPDKPWATMRAQGQARAQHRQLPVPDARRPGATSTSAAVSSATRRSRRPSSAAEDVSAPRTPTLVVVALRRLCPHRPQRGRCPPARQGIKAGLVRPITLWPFPDEAPSKATVDTAKAYPRAWR